MPVVPRAAWALLVFAVIAVAKPGPQTSTPPQAKPESFPGSLSETRKAAEQGDASAQFNLGGMYYDGRGVPQDYAEAARWYRKAAEQGYDRAQASLGSMYTDGQGVTQDYAESVRWYRKAAEQGYAPAQFNLGCMYANGQGVTQDYAEAHMWFNLAASRASGDDQKKFADAREGVAREMTAEQIADAQRRAREWKPKPVTK